MNTITELQKLVNNLLTIRNNIQQLTDNVDLLKAEKENLQNKLIVYMKDNNLKSWKTNENTFSIVSKYDVQVIDELRLMQELNLKNLTGYIIQKIDTTRFKSLANSLLKETGELFNGTTTVLSEYVSIRKN
ncbi:hypothetical protein EOM39_07945 [Candidatus Gracilibacteria bacterium]|nr:hypothetical protein [Candidatus Gracilibacteria bacterium]